MKKFIYTLLLVLAFASPLRAQWLQVGNTLQRTADGKTYRTNLGSPGFAYWYTKSQIDSIVSTLTPTVTGFTVLQQPSIGTVIPPGTTIDATFKLLFSPPQPPFASLSPSQVFELTGNSTQSLTLSYNYGKNTGTSNIASAKINGSTSGITQNINGASGTINETFSTNTTTTYTLAVTTIDPLTTNASVTETYAPGIYYGYASGSTATSSELLAHAGGGKLVSNGHSGSWTVVASGSNHPFIAIASNQGTITVIKDINGFDVTSSFPKVTISFNNGIGTGGFTQNYDVYTFVTATSSNYFFTTN